ncbi:hypothetical protein PsalN5692_03012 [Piscirickettsia salmonis]|nr:hypothetical protein PsalN5692_03012 [Piscirickettsia salmonis]
MKDWEQDLVVREQTLDAENRAALPILSRIRAEILQQMTGAGFQLGWTGSTYKVITDDNEKYQVPKRIYQIIELLKDPHQHSAHKLEKIKAINVSVATSVGILHIQ